MKKVRLIITKGDPQGIGPEVVEKALADARIKNLADFLVIESTDKIGFDPIEKAIALLKKRELDALVTAPVNKEKIYRSGIAFVGHTEYLAKNTNTKKYAMLLCGGALKVAPLTRHVPLKKVSSILTKDKIVDTIVLLDIALRKYFKLKRSKIGVCALNPHCGEGGKIGREEEEIIIPAIKDVKSKVSGVVGPISGDVIFYMAYKGKLDAVVSMYHDQGLAPLKMLAFNKGVNITLGLPFVRTSPDHGTAYDIAGKGIADPTSMKEAIKLAVKFCKAEESYVTQHRTY